MVEIIFTDSGLKWSEIYSQYHSGTYANQWMVLDLAKFSFGASLQAGLLHILEELPGLIHYEDMTEALARYIDPCCFAH